jgi:hypothetical protein
MLRKHCIFITIQPSWVKPESYSWFYLLKSLIFVIKVCVCFLMVLSCLTHKYWTRVKQLSGTNTLAKLIELFILTNNIYRHLLFKLRLKYSIRQTDPATILIKTLLIMALNIMSLLIMNLLINDFTFNWFYF